MAELPSLRLMAATLSLALAASAVLVCCGEAPALHLNPVPETPMPTLRSTLQRLAERLKQLPASWGRAASLRDLDARTLADIGLHPSEISSVEAEWRGMSAVSRRRIVRDAHHA